MAATPFEIGEQAVCPLHAFRCFNDVGQAEQVALCRNFTRTGVPEVFQLAGQLRPDTVEASLFQQPLDIRRHFTRETFLFQGGGKPAGQEQAFLGFTVYHAVLAGEMKGDQGTPGHSTGSGCLCGRLCHGEFVPSELSCSAAFLAALALIR